MQREEETNCKCENQHKNSVSLWWSWGLNQGRSWQLWGTEAVPGEQGRSWKPWGTAGSHTLLLSWELGAPQSSHGIPFPWNPCPGLGWCRRRRKRRKSDWRGWTLSGDRLPIPAALDLFLFIHCKSESILFIFILPCCDTLKIRGTFNFLFPFNTF